jgi:hypothetical protein
MQHHIRFRTHKVTYLLHGLPSFINLVLLVSYLVNLDL